MFGRLSFIGELQHTVLVAALEQAFKEQGVDLSFKLPLVPVIPSGFLFIELPRLFVLDAHQRAIVRPAQIGMKAGCGFNAGGWGFPLLPNSLPTGERIFCCLNSLPDGERIAAARPMYV